MHETMTLDPQAAGLAEPTPATPRAVSTIPTRHEINVLTEMANAVSHAGGGSAQAALIKMLFGRELGLSPMVALAEIDLIPTQSGIKPSLNARTQVCIIRRRGLGDIRLIEQTSEGAEVEAWRADDGNRKRFKFTVEDARRANLLSKDNWRKYPDSMYLARAIAKATKALFQEVFLGLAYTADELGAETDEDGRPVQLIPPPPTGITLKQPPAPLTATDAEQVATTVQATVQAIATPAAAPAPAAPPGPDLSRLKDEIRILARDCLQLAPTDWKMIRARFAPDDRPELTPAELQRLHTYLRNLHMLRFCVKELGLTPEQLTTALTKRGATRDVELSETNASELTAKVAQRVTPFKLNKHEMATALQLGRAAPPKDSGGNGLSPAVQVAA